MPIDKNLWNQAKQNEKVMNDATMHLGQIPGQVTMLVKSLHEYDNKINKAAGKPEQAQLKVNGKKELASLTANFTKWPATSTFTDKAIHNAADWIQKVTKAAAAAKDKDATTWAANAGKLALTAANGLATAKGIIAKFTPDYNNFKNNKNFK